MRLAKLTVHAGWHERNQCPVQTKVQLEGEIALDALVLWDLTSDEPVPLQAWPAEDGQINLAWIVTNIWEDDVRLYELRYGPDVVPVESEGVTLVETESGVLEVGIEGELFTRYNYGTDLVRPFLYPVLAGAGTGITRNWPMVEGVAGERQDHPHHTGVYTAQGSVNGVNNWDNGAGHGYIVHQGFGRVYEGPVAGGFTESLAWTDAEHKTLMTETRRITFYATDPEARVFDYSVSLHASEGEVTLGDTKEGGLLAVRVASSMDVMGPREGGRIQTATGGINEGEAWGKRAEWVDFSGPVSGDWVGIALMDHPSNPRYPTYWHVRNYGLMTINPIALHDYTGDPNKRWDLVIPAGETVTFAFRVYVHVGDANEALVADHWHDWVNPPSVEVQTGK
ncbi:MAG: hypothetical protein GX557_09855 [Chloroflexi bacterium]|nr:hypothetical protein [Chloroflexota bacterium]